MNSQQTAAVFFDHARDGAVLVLAGAGSGKTTVLTRRAAYLASLHPSGILALTFTSAAAREMEERARRLGASEDACQFRTFHAFSFGLIRSQCEGRPNWDRLGFAACPSLLDPAARRAWLAEARKGLGGDEPLDALERRVARPFTAQGGEEDPLRTRFRSHLLETGAVSFDDMVPLALRLLESEPAVLTDLRARIDHVLVDEFQDTSPDQLELARVILGERRSLFLVGDDDQSIYGFRGADPGNVTRALEIFPGMRVLKLETNYRSSAPIVDYANAIFSDKPERLRKVLRPGRAAAPVPVGVRVHGDGMEQARWLAGEIGRLQREGLAWGDIAILYRLNSLEPYYRSLLESLVGPEAAAGVVLKTVHGAKGLQWPAVFLVGLEDGILPYHRAEEAVAPESLAEEKRIFYVGVTRAERYLYLCACRRRMFRGKQREFRVSPFLARPGGFFGGLAARLRLRAKMGEV